MRTPQNELETLKKEKGFIGGRLRNYVKRSRHVSI